MASKMVELLRCGECYQMFDNPRFLPCGHSICGPPRKCLDFNKQCLVCKRIFTSLPEESFPKNLALKAFIKELKRANPRLEVNLSRCKMHNLKCEFYCRSCNDIVCKTCWQSDHSIPEDKHSIVFFEASNFLETVKCKAIEDYVLVNVDEVISKALQMREQIKTLKELVDDFRLREKEVLSSKSNNENKYPKKFDKLQFSSKLNSASNDLQEVLKSLSMNLSNVATEFSEARKSEDVATYDSNVPTSFDITVTQMATFFDTEVKNVVVDSNRTVFLQIIAQNLQNRSSGPILTDHVLRRVDARTKCLVKILSLSRVHYKSSHEICDIAVAEGVLYSLTRRKETPFAEAKCPAANNKCFEDVEAIRIRGFYLSAHNAKSMEVDRLVDIPQLNDEIDASIVGNSQYLILYVHESRKLLIFHDEKCLSTVSLLTSDASLLTPPSTLRSDCDYVFFENDQGNYFPVGFTLALCWEQLNPSSSDYKQNIDVTIQSLQFPKPRIITVDMIEEKTKRYKIGVQVDTDNLDKFLIHRNIGTHAQPLWSRIDEAVADQPREIEINTNFDCFKGKLACPLVPFMENAVLHTINDPDTGYSKLCLVEINLPQMTTDYELLKNLKMNYSE